MNWVVAALLALTLWAAPVHAAPAPRDMPLVTQDEWFGDFDAMRNRGLVRVLVPYSRTLFYYDKGHQKGVTAEFIQEFERVLNRKYGGKGKLPIVVAAVPVTRDRLLTDLAAGRGDIAAGDITITDRRRETVDFSHPIGDPFEELVITAPSAPPLTDFNGLAGRTVYAREITSYYDSLLRANQTLQSRGLAPMTIRKLPNDLADEDVLEKINAGMIPMAAGDSWVLGLWRKTLPRMQIHRDVVLSEEARMGWAFRKNSPLLAAEVNAFVDGNLNGMGVARMVIKRTAVQTRRLTDNRSERELARFSKVSPLFRQYGERYGFDHFMLAAQGYQESRLDQNARSHVGAIGIMQLMPATGRDMGVGNIARLEPNVHAGAKYLDWLLQNYFTEVELDDKNRALFAFASYNAGATRVNGFIREARKVGYDPKVWFDNVERVAARRVGSETVLYVRNIYKYYVAYKLAVEAAEAQEQARQKQAQ